jgi:hypothetical protein
VDSAPQHTPRPSWCLSSRCGPREVTSPAAQVVSEFPPWHLFGAWGKLLHNLCLATAAIMQNL